MKKSEKNVLIQLQKFIFNRYWIIIST